PGSNSATFTIVNKCSFPVWPGILSGAGTAQLATTGFALQPAQSHAFVVPTTWSGRLWGRTLCSTDSAGKFSCVTGDCGSSAVECNGGGATPPVTLAEFTLNGGGGLDFYDVSVVDGYNLPMLVEPRGKLHRDGMRGGLERRVSGGAEGEGGIEWGGRGVQERVRSLWGSAVLL
ncbi:hypothetical protein VIGAN_01322300, partial [Vigna angularis var. angularis]